MIVQTNTSSTPSRKICRTLHQRTSPDLIFNTSRIIYMGREVNLFSNKEECLHVNRKNEIGRGFMDTHQGRFREGFNQFRRGHHKTVGTGVLPDSHITINSSWRRKIRILHLIFRNIIYTDHRHISRINLWNYTTALRLAPILN